MRSLKLTPISFKELVFFCVCYTFICYLYQRNVKPILNVTLVKIKKSINQNLILTYFANLIAFSKNKRFSSLHIKFLLQLQCFLYHTEKWPFCFFLYIICHYKKKNLNVFINKTVPDFLAILLGSKKAVC